MFCYQPNFFSQSEPVTSELFTRLVISDAVVNRIKEYRERLPELDSLKAEISDKETLLAANPDPTLAYNQELKARLQDLRKMCRAITTIKSGLPVLMYQATFDETTSKRGFKGRWRKQSAARLNGLFMLDVDHVENPRTAIGDMLVKTEQPDLRTMCDALGILLVHITPSGRGLRLVAIADPEVGNIADNQAALSKKLGVEPDEACKDASRCSFCPGLEDILYINKEKLFTYENPEFDKKFGAQYRGNNSQATGSAVRNNHRDCGNNSNLISETSQVDSAQAVSGHSVQVSSGSGILEDDKSNLSYHGTSYQTIIEQWFKTANGGKPKTGDRHQSLFRLACDLRYITDFNPELLARTLEECEVGKSVANERGTDELKRIASDACARQQWQSIPKRMQRVLQAAGVQLHGEGFNVATYKPSNAVDYAAWWKRLQPLLSESPVLREACVNLPDHHKLAGVLAAGAMLGTYLTRAWWEHFDGKDYRLSYLVYIIGSAASGKSFITELDQLLMAPMRAADRVGREWERQYKEEMKKRAASSKNAKQEAPEQQHPVIRYVPSTISNAMLYRRLTDAVENETMGPDGQPIHLHCYTLEAELATALRAQTGSWAGKNDLELKSFHNEVAGVDYANDQSVNGIIQVNWNQVVSGTQEALSRKIKPSTVLDGLATRLTLFPMPANDFAMIERRRALRNHERECLLRSIGLKLEQVKGELRADRLVDFCYKYEEKLTDEARMEQDFCLDYFRKRIPVLMMRYALVRIICRDPERAIKGEPLDVQDSDLEFARLIGDWCLMAQMYFFGEMVMEAQERERGNFTPRKRSTKIREAYARLPEVLNTETLVREGVARDIVTASNTLRRWHEDGLIERVKNTKEYRKKYKEIPL